MKKKIDAICDFLNKYLILSHILLSLVICFVLEWLSRHSFIAACYFVIEHTGPYLFNSYVIFVVFSTALLVRRRTTLRMILVAVFAAFGIANCIILINRVTPFGFTDLNMIADLLTMQNTGYFTAQQAALSLAATVLYIVLMVLLFRHDKKQESRFSLPTRAAIVAAAFLTLPLVTTSLINAEVLTSYFGNLAQGYLDYGYVYGFATSMLGRGMNKPGQYNRENVRALAKKTDMGPSDIAEGEGPNVIIMLLESFFDVSEAKFIETSEDPIPFFHELEANFSTGHLRVPVVGAGTCNTEFEILTGMSCRFFGPGEYPQKTILKKTSVESVASDLHTLGYRSHVVHNNGGNFYSRANAFSMMGFDSFTCKEMLDITDYTPIGSWATDDILTPATKSSLDSTPGPDFVYTITVEAHGDYPKEKQEGKVAVQSKCRGKDKPLSNMWNYYINRTRDVDEFLKSYINMLDDRGEDTLFIAFGDHIPTMGLFEHEVSTGDLYKTKYITWNNFGMKKEDADLTSYQLAAEYLGRLGIHDGTMIDYNQKMTSEGENPMKSAYLKGLKLLQYDLLYGHEYAHDEEDLYPPSHLVMGSSPVKIDSAYNFGGSIHIYGDNFSKWSRVYINGEKARCVYHSGQCLEVQNSALDEGDVVVVNQTGSANTVFRSSNAYVY